ncbi:MAG: bifunctional oligoribonuclease/PAP phosphatase NrnA [Planctomycetota bacterium]|nr:MAG: bifunctional oligoribonuclease/PAP phosphatase NrnA [Planctomycetota bacterium]
MVSASVFQKAVELIDKSSNILLTTHIKPDGDACGSVAAMYDTLLASNKKVKMIFLSELPEWYEFLFTKKPAILGDDVTIDQLKQGQFFETDLIVLVDVNSNNQLPKLAEYLKQNDKPVLVIDHHVTGDGLGDVELIDTDAAATALIVFDFLKYANWPMTDKIAQALFVAAATDTGWFRFCNTDSRVHQTCAHLIEAGVNPTQLYHDLYENYSPRRFKLMIEMLNTLELHFDGRFATQYLSQQVFEKTGTAMKDTENLVNECQRIGTVEAAALFVKLKDGRVKCSLRSKGTIDVRKIAAKFGGGGHTMAAGVHLPGPLKDAKELILAEMAEQFKQLDGN